MARKEEMSVIWRPADIITLIDRWNIRNVVPARADIIIIVLEEERPVLKRHMAGSGVHLTQTP